MTAEDEEDYEEIEQYSCVVCHEMHGRMFRERKTEDYYCEDCLDEIETKLRKSTIITAKRNDAGDTTLVMTEMTEKECEHETSSVEFVELEDYDCGEFVKIKVKDICNNCKKNLGEEVQVYKFSHTERGWSDEKEKKE
jgi:hypothetical protein